MPCWKSPFDYGFLPSKGRLARWLVFLLASVGLLLPAVYAQAPPDRAVALDRDSEGLYLSARLVLEPGDSLEDALHKGIPMHFVWQADVVRPRWYWKDAVVNSAVRTVRLAYQPLARRWRVSHITGSPSALGLQHALYQNFDSLKDALASVGRVSRWHIADRGQLEGKAEDYRVAFRFKLDLSSLPRPFQIGVANHGDWNIVVDETLPVPEAPIVPEPPEVKQNPRAERTEGRSQP